MRILTVILGLVLATGCSSFFKRGPSSANGQKPKHYIMTLHGVRGTETAFGDFHGLIKQHLEKIDPSYEVVPINIVYPKGIPEFNAHSAAIAINQKLDAAIPVLNPADKISVLAYSMGGQVGMTWYYDSLKDEAHKKYPLQTKKFFSLGAAYWGSKEAALGVNVDNIIGQADAVQMASNWLEANPLPGYVTAVLSKEKLAQMIQAQKPNVEKFRNMIRSQFANFGDFYNQKFLNLSKISYAELVNLAVASDESTENRLANINNKNNTRWISLSSLVKCMETDLTSDEPGCQSFQNDYFKELQLNVFGKYTFGYSRRETDNSVITPSANANFIYAVETTSDYQAGQLTPAANFRYSIPEQQQRFILAEGLHATVVPAEYYAKTEKALSKGGEAWKNLADDVALIYKADCEKPEENKCKHPAYKFIVQEFADCENIACDQVQVDKIIKPLFVASDATSQATLKSELHGFVIEMNLRLPKGYNMNAINHQNIFNTVQVKFADRAAHLVKIENSNYDVILARPSELGSLIIKKMTRYSNQDQLRVAMMGLIVPEAGKPFSATELEKGVPLEFTVNLPGLKARKVQAVVRPYYTTYADLMMAK
ncbi:MAG: hypothetical protein H7256_14330 [Bdellovibrio sp.]|nr:hypothetical protein [Bdellovibrio sp.]